MDHPGELGSGALPIESHHERREENPIPSAFELCVSRVWRANSRAAASAPFPSDPATNREKCRSWSDLQPDIDDRPRVRGPGQRQKPPDALASACHTRRRLSRRSRFAGSVVGPLTPFDQSHRRLRRPERYRIEASLSPPFHHWGRRYCVADSPTTSLELSVWVSVLHPAICDQARHLQPTGPGHLPTEGPA